MGIYLHIPIEVTFVNGICYAHGVCTRMPPIRRAAELGVPVALVIGSGVAANTLSPSDTTYSRSKMPARRRPAYSRLILMFGRACGGHFNQPSLWQTRRSVGFAPAAVDRRAAAIEQWCDAMIFVAVGSLTGMVTRMQRAAHCSDAQQWDMEIRALMRGG